MAATNHHFEDLILEMHDDGAVFLHGRYLFKCSLGEHIQYGLPPTRTPAADVLRNIAVDKHHEVQEQSVFPTPTGLGYVPKRRVRISGEHAARR